MDSFKEFLEYSSISGMSLISSTRSFARLFWILVVILGFAGAILMIFESFENWRINPISTTIETFPISNTFPNVTFPNVTICPPRDLFLNLNHDIKKSETIKLSEDLRKELLDYALDVIQDEFYNELMTNMSLLQDPDRYYNWYYGYTKLEYPYWSWSNKLWFFIATSAICYKI